jgi:hypothetical protein
MHNPGNQVASIGAPLPLARDGFQLVTVERAVEDAIVADPQAQPRGGPDERFDVQVARRGDGGQPDCQSVDDRLAVRPRAEPLRSRSATIDSST